MNESSADEPNPYSAPSSVPDVEQRRHAGPPARWKLALTGAVWSILWAFPVAGGMALLYRFPIPLIGYRSGFEAIVPALVAVLFYGILFGGFILLAALGGISGAVIATLSRKGLRYQRLVARAVSLAVTAACLFVLATLDKIIGTW